MSDLLLSALLSAALLGALLLALRDRPKDSGSN